ncbi:MAG: NADPH:quinone reductase [Pseudomonadota bacterium]
MRAAWYEKNGEARDVLVVGELPDPTPGPGEVRIRMATSGVNPSDVKSRRNKPLTSAFVVPHSDGAGVIDQVGAGVAASRLGERVWTWNAQWQRPMGTASEYVVLPSAQAVALPDGTSFAEGACLGIPALTAVQAVRLAGDVAGKTVLVTGASSSVGHYASQLLKLAGARVIGTVGSPEKARHAQAAGVADVIYYKAEPVAERVKELTGGRGADAIIDMDLSSTSQLLPAGVLAPHGLLVCYGSNSPGEIAINFRTMLWSSLGIKCFLVYDLQPADRGAAIARLTELLQGRQLQHGLGLSFTLDDIASAHAAVESGREIGNIVVNISPPRAGKPQ